MACVSVRLRPDPTMSGGQASGRRKRAARLKRRETDSIDDMRYTGATPSGGPDGAPGFSGPPACALRY